MDKDEDDGFLKKWSDVIKSGEIVRCPNCRKKINWKDAPHEEIPGIPFPVPFCDESCKEQFINGQINYHEEILHGLHDLKNGAMKCPNCGEEAVRFILRDVPFVNIIGEEFIGMAVHKEVVGVDGEPVPECFCNLDGDDWRDISGIRGSGSNEHE